MAIESPERASFNSLKLQLRIALPICCALAVMNIVYNNLFTNLRFRCKICCKTAGLCVYDAVNFLFGFCCMKKLCQDRCCTVGTIIKWILKFAVFGYSTYLVLSAKKKMDKQPFGGAFWMDIILVAYILQHVIFVVFKPILYFLYFFMTFCCDKGIEFGEN